jgi:hypothetical protein
MGADSLLLSLLEEGIIVHHGRLPARVRVAIEDLARADAVRLIVATTTLAQGINLPIKTVLVRGLQMNESERVTPMTFWNICGRAGRAMKENEGQILFCVDETKTWGQLRNLNNAISSVLDKLDQGTVVSAMLLVLRDIAEQWNKAHPNVSLSDLCLHLAENDFDWAEAEERTWMRSIVDILDGHLLAVSEEFSIDPSKPDQIQEIMHGSLLFIQLRANGAVGVTEDEARDIFHARIRYIHRSHPDPRVRERLYQLGMSLSACERIEHDKVGLLNLFCEAAGWFEWSHAERSDPLLRISQVIFSLPDTTPTDSLPEPWPAILASWLGGVSTSEMVTDVEIRPFTTSPNALCLLIEELCGYLMPWGLNSILMHLKAVAVESGKEIPPVCSYFAGMTKYGVSDPVAVCIIPYLDQDRVLATTSAAFCPHDFQHPVDVVRWIMQVTERWLIDRGMAPDLAAAVIRKRDSQRHPRSRRESRRTFDLSLAPDQEDLSKIAVGDKVLVIPGEGTDARDFRVFTLQGHLLGSYSLGVVTPAWWGALHLVDSEVSKINLLEDGCCAIAISMIEL